MSALLLVAATLGAAWVEITGGLRPNDDISAVAYGDSPDDILVGTTLGFLFRSRDGGESYQVVFEPTDIDPLVEPQLNNFRAASVGDLGRGPDRAIDPRNRAALAKEAADLSGSERNRQKTRGTPLLSSLMRGGARSNAAITLIERCGGRIYLVTPSGLWRSADDGDRFERLNVGPTSVASQVWWVTCDGTRPGRIAINTDGGVLESRDWGDTFFMFDNPFPDGTKVAGINFQSNGRLVLQQGSGVYRERVGGSGAAGGYERVCDYGYGDSFGSNTPTWIWWAENHDRVILYAVTNDGILVCDDGKMRRFTNMAFGRRPATFVWIDWTTDGHVFVATDRDIWETFDDGKTFAQVFDTPTQRTIRRLTWKPKVNDDLLVATGGQLFRRVSDDKADKRHRLTESDQATVNRTVNRAPLYEVVLAALDKAELEPGSVAAKRTDSRLRALLPQVVMQASYADKNASDYLANLVHGGADFPTIGDHGQGHAIWRVFAQWDLSGLLFNDYTTNHTWADVDRLRQQLTWRVQDTWVMWAQAVAAEAVPGINLRQRLYHELKRREAAAYLHKVTGGVFAVFEPSTRLATNQGVEP